MTIARALRTCLFTVGGLLATARVHAQDVVWQQVGQTTNSNFGWFVASGSDVDVDGIQDILTQGFVQTNPSQPPNEPHIYVYSGSTGLLLLDVKGTAGAYDAFGSSGAGVGDIDGDGRGDIAVGAPTYTGSQAAEGAVFVYSGASGSLVRSLYGEEQTNYFGTVIRGLGDITQDGVPDLLISAPDYTYYDPFYASGKAYAYSGKDGTLLFSVVGARQSLLGTSLDRAGDVDADGVADFIIGAPEYTVGYQSSHGQVYVFSGKSFQMLYQYTGKAGDALGVTVAGAGDLDGDGHADFAMTRAKSPRHVYAYSGKDGSLLLDLLEQQSKEDFGSTLSGGVDVSGDGVPDLLVGAIANDSGGSWAGRLYLFSGRTGRVLYTFDGSTGDSVSWGQQILPDVTNDGIGDLAYSAPGYNNGQGFVSVNAGNDLFLQATPTLVTAGKTLELDTRGGPQGGLSMLALVEFNGAPTFIPVRFSFLDQNGESSLAGTMPSGFAGDAFGFKAFAVKSTGHGFVDSSKAIVSVY